MSSNEEILSLIGRSNRLFASDIEKNSTLIAELIENHRFLVIGGAGSIGQAVVKEIFKRKPKALHVVDLSENNMVELVRDLRSSIGYIDGDFRTFSIDCGSSIFKAFLDSHGPYDYVLNLSALKHVRSEKDPFTLMRLIEVNILNTLDTIDLTKSSLKKYFCVSTDKAANPANMMGASKRIMEMFLVEKSKEVDISTARFANVAFSDGSLPHGFNLRLQQKQPLSAPSDILRYFVTSQEAGELCLMSCLLGENSDIFFPNNEQLVPTSFSGIAIRLLESRGFEPVICESEEEARHQVDELARKNKWPCFFSASDTTGEKPCEEFYTESEIVDLNRFQDIGVVGNTHYNESMVLREFLSSIQEIREAGHWSKADIVGLFNEVLPDFIHNDTGKYLDEKM